MPANVDITIVHTWDRLSGKTLPKGKTPTFSDSIQDTKKGQTYSGADSILYDSLSDSDQPYHIWG